MNALSKCEPKSIVCDANDEVCRRVRLYLAHSGHQCLPQMAVAGGGGVISLSGIVPTSYARRLVLACAQRVAGVRKIYDHIQVVRNRTAGTITSRREKRRARAVL